jgi:hypothetical protein
MKPSLTPASAAAVVDSIGRGETIARAAQLARMSVDSIGRWEARGRRDIAAGDHASLAARFAVGLAHARAAVANQRAALLVVARCG